MTIRFYDNNNVTYSPHFIAQDSNKEKTHNGRTYQKMGVVKEARSFMWSIGQIFKGLSLGVMGVVALPLALCSRTTSHSCFKSFVKSLHQAWRREEIVKVYVGQHFSQQSFFKEPVIIQENHFPVNPITNPTLTQNPLLQDSRPEQNPRPFQSETSPARPLTNPILTQNSEPFQSETSPCLPASAQLLSFSLDEQTIEVVMKVIERRYEYVKNEWDRGNFELVKNYVRETFELVGEWFDRAPANYDRPLACARLLRGLGNSDLAEVGYDLAHGAYSKLLEEYPEDIAIKKEFVEFALEDGCVRRSAEVVYLQVKEILKQEPDNIKMHVIYGDLLFSVCKFREAVEQYRQVLILNPNYVEALMGLAKCLICQNDLTQAHIEFEKAITIAPEKSMLRYEYAKGLIKENLEREAAEQYRKALELDPCNVQIRADYLHLLMSQSLFDEAIRICEEGLTLSIDPIQFDDIYCTVFAKRGETEKLERYCQQRLGEQPDATGIRRIYAQILLEKDDHEGVCQQYYAILEKEPDNLDVLRAYFEALKRLGQSEKVEQFIRRSIQDNPNDFRLHYQRADFLHRQGQLDEAIQVLRAFLVNFPDNTGASLKLMQILEDAGKDEELKQLYENYLERNPNSFCIRRGYGDLLKRLNDFVGAAEHYKLALELDFHFYHLDDYFDALRQSGKSEEISLFYERVLEKDPSDQQVRSSYAEYLTQEGKSGEAAEQYEKLLQLNDGSLIGEELAEVLVELGRMEEAAEHYRQAMNSDPANFSSSYRYFKLLTGLNRTAEIGLGYEVLIGSGQEELRKDYALWLKEQNQLAGAAEQYEKLLQLNDGSLIRQGLAEVLVELGRMEEAAEHYRQAMNSDPAHFSSPYRYLRLLTDLNRTAEVGLGYEVLIESGQERLRKDYALWLKEQNQLAEAAEQFRKALKADPFYFDSAPYLEVLDALNLFDEVEQCFLFLQANQNAYGLVYARISYSNYLRECNRVAEAEEQLRLC